jgi:hypothetical protein
MLETQCVPRRHENISREMFLNASRTQVDWPRGKLQELGTARNNSYTRNNSYRCAIWVAL